MVKRLVSGMLLAFVLSSCGDDGSGSNPVEPVSEMTSSSSIIAEPESSSDKGTSSIKESSSSKAKSSSSKDNKHAETSSSGKAKSSSSLARSSSSLKGSSSSAEVSSSSSEEKESSSSSVKTSSSSQKSSSSSAKSSSSKPKSSSSSAKSSSSSAKSSSSTVVIPSKLYDCEEYKCVTTKYLNPEIEYGEYLDVRDTQVYRTVQIGEQIWMAQNLNYKSDTLSSCFDLKDSNCTQWGRLYTWEKAMAVCPDGWHLPDTADYFVLAEYVDENNGDLAVGKCLKSGRYNMFGFSGLLGSGYSPGGVAFDKGGKTNGDAYFWTSSEAKNHSTETYAIMRGLWYSDGIFGILDWKKEDALAVRCIKD